MTYWAAFGDLAYPYEREFKFHPARDWRFDFSWIVELDESDWCLKVAAEVEGGNWTNGRHSRGAGFEGDCQKYNEAILLGWKVLRFTPSMLKDAPDVCIGQVVRLLRE